MKTLIAGINGFTGQRLIAGRVGRGHEVAGLKADLTDAASLEGRVADVRADWVVHLAGIAFGGHGDAKNFCRVNLMGTRNLLAALAACDKKPSCVLLATTGRQFETKVVSDLQTDWPSYQPGPDARVGVDKRIKVDTLETYHPDPLL